MDSLAFFKMFIVVFGLVVGVGLFVMGVYVNFWVLEDFLINNGITGDDNTYTRCIAFCAWMTLTYSVTQRGD